MDCVNNSWGESLFQEKGYSGPNPTANLVSVKSRKVGACQTLGRLQVVFSDDL